MWWCNPPNGLVINLFNLLWGGNVGNSKKLAEYKIPPTEKTIIGADVWVGARATVVAGV